MIPASVPAPRYKNRVAFCVAEQTPDDSIQSSEEAGMQQRDRIVEIGCIIGVVLTCRLRVVREAVIRHGFLQWIVTHTLL